MGLYVLNPILAGYDVRDFTLNQRILTETRIVIWYISLLLWPNPNRFSIEHDIDLSTSLINPYTTLLSSITIFIIIIGSIFYRKKYPLITYGIIWFFLNLVIESTIIPLELIFEHRVYLPSVGIIISFVLMLYFFIRKIFNKLSEFDFKKVQWCIFILLFSLMTLMTYDRNNFFYDIISLNEHNINNSMSSPRSYANLAVSLARIGKNEEAIEKARYAIEMGKENNDSYYVAANTILLAYENMGQPYKGLKEAEKLLDEQPLNASRQGLVTMCSNLAVIYAKMEDYKCAVYSIQRLLLYTQKLSGKEIDVEDLRFPMLQYILHEVQRKNLKLDLDGDGACDPGDLPTTTWVARFLLSMGFEAKAKELLCKSKNEYPNDATALNLLKNLEANENLNRIQSAKWSFREKYINHPFSRFNACMATAYLIRKYKLPSPFITLGENLLSYCETLQPSAADVQLLRGWYYFEKRQLDQAIASVNLALKLDNNNSKAYLALGLFLTEANQIEGSIDAFRTCLRLYPGCPERIILQDLIKDLEKKLTDASVVHPLANMNVDSEVLGTSHSGS
ncbi:hypothetical protein DAMNIGENAA_19960 [Desulforhabdus amnigena]|uniref:Tetratricopeptide repeat protein n=1 Tax=Desulforhabdus amnigena TaxID=40218 RepID=A0A9W6FSX6_9BACT|nr:hypothetical protein DAMNIGENAA_19960 [Desulforhabdus amnigena]